MRDSQSEQMRRGILVLGMHRSGTSAVTGALRELGVELGDRLMPGRPGHNERGYFESLEVVDLNDQILRLGGSSWQSPLGPPEAWFDSYDAGKLEWKLRDLIQRRFSGDLVWAVKDPRLCRLLPLWLKALDSERLSFVLAYRDPVEVAGSLAARNGFSTEKSAWLWLDHTLAAEHRTRGTARGLLGYADLLADPVAALDRWAAETEITWPRREGGEERLASFVAPSLRNQHNEGEGLTGTFGALASELYAAIRGGEASLRSSGFWNDVGARFREALAARDLVLAGQSAQEVSEVRGMLDERTAWIRLLDERIGALQRQIREREEQLARQQREALELADRIEEFQIEFEAGQRRLEQQGVELQAQRMVAEHGRNLAEMIWASKPWRMYLKFGQLKKRFSSGAPLPKPKLEPAVTTASAEAGSGDDAEEKGDGGRPAPAAERASRGPLRLPSCDAPTVSVVIPVFNQIDFTWQCLDSIARTATSIDYEVLVIDDLSTDDTRERLAEVENLRLICKEENTGFIGSCNRGAQESRGRYVLFLNNDTTVTEGWLEALVETFEHFPEAGLVGGKLIFPDGTLQEAGGIVWRDGSAWNFGRGNHPDAPEYSYARRADYCSGACLMIERDLFMELDMFDRLYAPAYYEDTDLAFRVRRAGRQVIFQPHCRIYHYEGASCGTDLTSGIKQYQVENGKRFFERWRETLSVHRANGIEPEREKERSVRRRALIIDHRMPTPDQDSGSLRMSGIVEILREEGWKVTFLPNNLDPIQPYTRDLQLRGVEVVHAPFVHSVKQHLDEAGALYDVVILSRVHVAASHIDDVRRYCPQAMVLFDTVDLHFVRELRRAEVEGDPSMRRRAEKTRDLELSVARRATKTIVVSNVEGEVLREHDPTLDVAMVSNIYDVATPERSFAERSGALFVGGFEHNPNVDAVVWLVQEILPRVCSELPDFHLFIVGSKPTSEVLDLASESVTVTGFVPTVDPYLERCRLSVAPLRFGAGVKGKLTQSLAHGLPCVATGLAAEGMGLEHEVDVLIGDTAEEFAQQILRGHENEALWNRLSAGGLRNTEENASMDVARRHLLRALDAVPVGTPVSS